MRPSLFLDVTRHRFVVCCRRFGTTYRSQIQESCGEEELTLVLATHIVWRPTRGTCLNWYKMWTCWVFLYVPHISIPAFALSLHPTALFVGAIFPRSVGKCRTNKRGRFKIWPELFYVWETQNIKLLKLNFLQNSPLCNYALLKETGKLSEAFLEAI
jgi:hypothetical protein